MALNLPRDILALKIAMSFELGRPAEQQDPRVLIDLNLWEERGDILAAFIAKIRFENQEDRSEFQQLLSLCQSAYNLVENKTRNRKVKVNLKHKRCFILQIAAHAYAEAGDLQTSRNYSAQIYELLKNSSLNCANNLSYLASLENKFSELLYLASAFLNQQDYKALASSTSAVQTILSSTVAEPTEDELSQQQHRVLVVLQRELISAIQTKPELTDAYQEALRRITEASGKHSLISPRSPAAKRQKTARGAARQPAKPPQAPPNIGFYDLGKGPTITVIDPIQASTSSSSSSSAQAARAKPSITPAAVIAAAAAANAAALAPASHLAQPADPSPESTEIARLSAELAAQARALEQAQQQNQADAEKIRALEAQVDVSSATKKQVHKALKRAKETLEAQSRTIQNQGHAVDEQHAEIQRLTSEKNDLTRRLSDAESRARKATEELAAKEADLGALARTIRSQQEQLDLANAKIAASPAAALSANAASLYGRRAAEQQSSAPDEAPRATQ